MSNHYSDNQRKWVYTWRARNIDKYRSIQRRYMMFKRCWVELLALGDLYMD